MSIYRLGAAKVDSAARTITINGSPRGVSLKAMTVLDMLVEAAGDVVTRDALLKRAWPNVCVGEEVLTQAIAELRRAFGDNRRAPEYIATVPKTGYRLAAEPPAPEIPNDLLLPPISVDPKTSIEALTDYFSACDAFDRGGQENINAVIEYCRSAIERDQTFAAAHARLSIAYAYKQLYYSHDKTLMTKALSSARTAIEYDRTSPEGYAAQGFALANLGDLDHALTSFNAAIRLRNDAFYSLNYFGVVLFSRGAYDTASRLFDHAARLRGDAYQAVMMSAKASRSAGDEKTAAARIKRAALRCDQRLLEDPDDIRALVCKISCEIDAHGVGATASLLDRLSDNDDPITYYVAAALARAGETGLALDRIEAIVDNGWADLNFLKSDRDLDPLRSEPRFQKIANALAA